MLLFPVSPSEVRGWGLIWLAGFPLQHGSVHPSDPLSPCPARFAAEPASNAPRQGPRHPRTRPEVGRGWPRQAESRVELSCIHRHVPTWIPPQSCARARALSGETHIHHKADRLWKKIYHFSIFTCHILVWVFIFYFLCFNTFLSRLSIPKTSRCWATSPKVPLDPYWKWKTRPNKRLMLSKSVFYDKTQSSLLSPQLSNLYHSSGYTKSWDFKARSFGAVKRRSYYPGWYSELAFLKSWDSFHAIFSVEAI